MSTQVALSAVNVPWALTWRMAAVVRKVGGQLKIISRIYKGISVITEPSLYLLWLYPAVKTFLGNFTVNNSMYLGSSGLHELHREILQLVRNNMLHFTPDLSPLQPHSQINAANVI